MNPEPRKMHGFLGEENKVLEKLKKDGWRLQDTEYMFKNSKP